MDVRKYNVEILKNDELEYIDGGKNLLEYAAYATGYASAAVSDFFGSMDNHPAMGHVTGQGTYQ